MASRHNRPSAQLKRADGEIAEAHCIIAQARTWRATGTHSVRELRALVRYARQVHRAAMDRRRRALARQASAA